MIRHLAKRSQPVRRRARGEHDRRARGALLEAAGEIFAAKGFDRATGKEICRRAGVNAAAVNYYFGGVEGLYAAVVREAHRRLLTLSQLADAVAGHTDARSQLRAIVELLVGALTGPVSESWVLRVIGREVVDPSAALQSLRRKELLPRARLLRGVISQLMELHADHPAVARGCVSVISQCLMLLVLDRRILKRMFPQFSFSPDDAPALVDHLVEFSLAGLAAVARAG